MSEGRDLQAERIARTVYVQQSRATGDNESGFSRNWKLDPLFFPKKVKNVKIELATKKMSFWKINYKFYINWKIAQQLQI